MMERCICGAAMQSLSIDSGLPEWDPGNVWIHVPGSDTRCTDPRRISDMIPDQDMIRDTAKLMAELKDRTRRASGEMENVASAVAELTEGIRDLQADLNRPETIRHVTLMEVWAELVGIGDLAGARLVRDMLKEDKS